MIALSLAACSGESRRAQTPPPQLPKPAASAVSHLAEAIRIGTISYEGPRSDHLPAFAEFHEFIARSYPRIWAQTRHDVFSNDALLLAWPGSDPNLKPAILLAHQDVVPAEVRTWSHPPFAGDVANGSVWGRGAIDDKGQLVAILEAAEGLAARGVRPRRTIYFAFGGDEERDGIGAQAIAAHLKRTGVHAEYVLDEGLLGLDPFPLTGRRAAFIGVAEKGYATLRLVATDKAGHASAPPAETALTKLSRAAIAVHDIPMSASLDGLTTELLRTIAPDMTGTTRLAVDNLWLFGPLVRREFLKEAAGTALLRTTIAPTMAHGSVKENVLPSTATMHLNVRLHPNDRAAAVLEKVRAAVKPFGVRADYVGPVREATRISSTQSTAYRRLHAIASQIMGRDVPVGPALVIGATDARLYQDVADDVYRFQPIILTQQEAETIHGTDERLSLDNLGRMIFFYTRLLSI